MNKVTFFVGLLLASWAHGFEKVEIVVSTKNRLNFGSRHEIIISKNELIFDHEKIDLLQLPILRPSLQVLAKVIKAKPDTCAAGSYTHQVKRCKKLEVQTGCLGSKQASRLIQSLEMLQNARLK